MDGSNEFRVLWNVSTAFFVMIEKLSSTNCFQVLGGAKVVLMAISSIFSMQIFATTGLTGLPIAHPCICLYVCPLSLKDNPKC